MNDESSSKIVVVIMLVLIVSTFLQDALFLPGRAKYLSQAGSLSFGLWRWYKSRPTILNIATG